MNTNLYSHSILGKGFKELISHINETLKYCDDLLEIFVKDTNIRKYYFKLLKYVCAFHDLGKILPQIQNAIKKSEKLPENHSPLSALLFLSFPWYSNELNEKEKLIIGFIIYHHHSDLCNLIKEKEKDEKGFEDKIKEKDSIKEKCLKILEELKNNSMFLHSFENIINESIDIKKWEENIRNFEVLNVKTLFLINDNENIYYFIDTLFVYALFSIADRFSAAGFDEEDFKCFLKKYIYPLYEKNTYIELLKKFENYYFNLTKNKESTELDKVRNEAQKEIFEEFEKNKNKDYRILKIILPTGLGKTLVGIKLALEISTNYGLPIIYSLPFINLIEQTEETLKNILGEKAVEKFHHITFEIEEEQKLQREFLNFFFSPIIVTTFVQLLNSIFTGSRSMIIKLPVLLNSIWIIDEVQNIPPEFYIAIEKIFEAIKNRKFPVRIILMSATCPPIFKDFKEIVIQLPQNYEKYYYKLNRYSIEIKGTIKLEEYIQEISKTISTLKKENGKKKIGIIVNKVDECIKIFEKLKKDFNCVNKVSLNDLIKKLNEKGDKNEFISFKKNFEIMKKFAEERFDEKLGAYIREFIDKIAKQLERFEEEVVYENDKKEIGIVFLASNISSYEKMIRSSLLKKIIDKTPYKIFILCSTQVLEAGVDADFDLIFRDFAPLDSLIQTAGRCNRNAKSGITKCDGKIIVFEVLENSSYTYQPIYHNYWIDKTKDILPHNKRNFDSICVINESEILKYLEKYFDYYEIQGKKEYVELLKRLKFKEVGKNLKVIKEEPFRYTFVLDFENKNESIFDLLQKIKENIKELKENNYQKGTNYEIEFYKHFYPLVELLSCEKSVNEELMKLIEKLIKIEKIKIEIKKVKKEIKDILPFIRLFLQTNEYYSYHGISFNEFTNIE